MSKKSELVERFLSGQITEEEIQHALEMLEKDPLFISEIVNALEMDDLLRERFSAERSSMHAGSPGKASAIRKRTCHYDINGTFKRKSLLVCVCSWSIFIVTAIVSYILFVWGTPAHAPKGLPSLYPCSVMVIQNGVPLSGATVSLHSQSPSRQWSCGGVSDKNGIAALRTNGFFQGVPRGRFRLTVTKIVPNGKNLISTPPKALPKDEAYVVFSVVDPKLAVESTTNLLCEVGSTNNPVFCYDVGKPVVTPCGTGELIPERGSILGRTPNDPFRVFLTKVFFGKQIDASMQ